MPSASALRWLKGKCPKINGYYAPRAKECVDSGAQPGGSINCEKSLRTFVADCACRTISAHYCMTALTFGPPAGSLEFPRQAIPRKELRPQPGRLPLPPTGLSSAPAGVPLAPEEFTERHLDDLAWVARVQTGDQDAARLMVDRLYPTIIKCVRYRLPRRTSEEDLVQAIYARVFTFLDQFSGAVPLEHWVSRIAVNTSLNFLKHERVRPELRMSDLREEEEAVVRQMLRTTDDLGSEQTFSGQELLERLLGRLRPDERLVITLLHLEEKTTKEISQMTGWSVALVKVKAFRTRQKLRKLWQSLLRSERT